MKTQPMNKKDLIKRVILLLIILYVFLLSIQLMSGSFKLFGTEFAERLISLTTNPFVGLFIGILATSLVQSSSISTSIIVGLTAAGALTIGNAIPIIMGANIGTSITNTIVSLGHITKKDEFRKAFAVATVHDIFNFIIVLILFPLELYFHILERSSLFLTKFFLGSSLSIQFSSPLDLVVKPIANLIRDFFINQPVLLLIMSLSLLFVSLRYFVKVMKPLAETEFKHLLNKHIFNTPLKSFVFGILFTIAVQSSSVSTSLIVPLAGVGILSLVRLFPYILGANIGTTFTALMASLATGSPAAVTVAIEHFLFNTLGSISIYPFRKIPINLCMRIANLSLKSKMYPLAYIVSVFYLLPALMIFLFL